MHGALSLLNGCVKSAMEMDRSLSVTQLSLLYRVSIKSFPDYKHLLQENYCMWNTNIYIYIYFSKCDSRSFLFVQNLNYCTLRYTKLVCSMTRWFTRTALKGLTHSINSLITHTGPATSIKVTNTSIFYKLWIQHFDAFNIWQRLSVLISEFPLRCDRRFCSVIPQNTLGFLLRWRHFDTSRLCNCKITINTWHKIWETNLSNGKKICFYST